MGDWGVSRRQRLGDGSVVPVPQEDLPVELPKDVEFSGLGNPLELHPTWKYTTHKGQKAVVRETDKFLTHNNSYLYHEGNKTVVLLPVCAS